MLKQSPCALALVAVVTTWHVAHAEDDVQPTASRARLVLKAHEKGARFAVYSPDGRTLATGGTDQSVRLWDVATGKEKGVLGRHESAVLCGAFSPDGKRLVTGSNNHGTKLWNLDTGAEAAGLDTGRQFTWSVAFALDGKTFATASREKSIKLWDTATGTLAERSPMSSAPGSTAWRSLPTARRLRRWSMAPGKRRSRSRKRAH